MVPVIHVLSQLVFSKLFCGLSCASSLEEASFWDDNHADQFDAVCDVWSEHWQAELHPFNLGSNAGSTHTSISQTQPLDMMLSKCTQLLWSTMVRPVLSRNCPVKPLYGLYWPPCCSSVSGSWQSSYSLCHLYVEQQFFFSDPQRVLCHEGPCWTSSDQYERVRVIAPNLTHLLPIHSWDLVTLTSHMTMGRENG